MLTFDEDDNASGNQIPTIFSGARVQAGDYGENVDHYGVLRTITDAFGLTPMGPGSPILDVWTPASGNQPPLGRLHVVVHGPVLLVRRLDVVGPGRQHRLLRVGLR